MFGQVNQEVLTMSFIHITPVNLREMVTADDYIISCKYSVCLKPQSLPTTQSEMIS